MIDQSTPQRLRYDEGCLAAHSLNLIGDRWALLVLRELMFSAKRFQLIRSGLPGITASVLTARLAQLVQAGVVTHDPQLGLYALTTAGQATLPVLESLCRWALCVPGHDPRRFISPSALMISMGVMVRRDADLADHGVGKPILAGFDFGSEAFEMHIQNGQVHTAAVRNPVAPVILSGTGNQLAVAVYGPAALSDLARSGAVGVAGDMAAGQRFVDLFRLAPTG